ncbi:hypothetical protein GMRT_13149 [Giardia muris]|uniref:Uncharacterized protein n=1 Tax=Giardia muris TaxID=5742 RepID=A0A4Z1T258_GIAMU|nr:hypothetical protein GMRT_13149 [Giardia muris]|eukprot:TNJ26669.1 hypothetical protein GMRT_13149 [Giardia muris]
MPVSPELYTAIPGSDAFPLDGLFAAMNGPSAGAVRLHLGRCLDALYEKYASQTGFDDVLARFSTLLLDALIGTEVSTEGGVSEPSDWLLLTQLLAHSPDAPNRFVARFTESDLLAPIARGIPVSSIRVLYDTISAYLQALFITATRYKGESTDARTRRMHLVPMAVYCYGVLQALKRASLRELVIDEVNIPCYLSVVNTALQLCRRAGMSLQLEVNDVHTQGELLLMLASDTDGFRHLAMDSSSSLVKLLDFERPQSSPLLYAMIQDADKLVTRELSQCSRDVPTLARPYYIALYKLGAQCTSFSRSSFINRVHTFLPDGARQIYMNTLTSIVERFTGTSYIYEKVYWHLLGLLYTAYGHVDLPAIQDSLQRVLRRRSKAVIFAIRFLSLIDGTKLPPDARARLVGIYGSFFMCSDLPNTKLLAPRVTALYDAFPEAFTSVLQGDALLRVSLATSLPVSLDALRAFFRSTLFLAPGHERVDGCPLALFADALRACLAVKLHLCDLIQDEASNCLLSPSFSSTKLSLDGFLVAVFNSYGGTFTDEHYGLLFRFVFENPLRNPCSELIHQIHALVERYLAAFTVALSPAVLNSEHPEYASVHVLHYLLVRGGLFYFSIPIDERPVSLLGKVALTQNLTLSIICVATCLLQHLSPRFIDSTAESVLLTSLSERTPGLILGVVNEALRAYETVLSADSGAAELPGRLSRLIGHIAGCCAKLLQGEENEVASAILQCLLHWKLKRRESRLFLCISEDCLGDTLTIRNPKEVCAQAAIWHANVINTTCAAALVEAHGLQAEADGSLVIAAYPFLWIYLPIFIDLLNTLFLLADMRVGDEVPKLALEALIVPMSWTSFGFARPSELLCTTIGDLLVREAYMPLIEGLGVSDGQTIDFLPVLAAQPPLGSLKASPLGINSALPYSVTGGPKDYLEDFRFKIRDQRLAMLYTIYPAQYLKCLVTCTAFWTTLARVDEARAAHLLGLFPFYFLTLNCKVTTEQMRNAFVLTLREVMGALDPEGLVIFKERLHVAATSIFNHFTDVPNAFTRRRGSYNVVNAILAFTQLPFLSGFSKTVITFLLEFLQHPQSVPGLSSLENRVSFIHLADAMAASLNQERSGFTRAFSSECLLAAVGQLGVTDWEEQTAWQMLFGTVAKVTFYNIDMTETGLTRSLTLRTIQRLKKSLETLIYRRPEAGMKEATVRQTIAAGLIFAHVILVYDDQRFQASLVHLLFSSHVSLRGLGAKIFYRQYGQGVATLIDDTLRYLRSCTYGNEEIQCPVSLLPSLEERPLSRAICDLLVHTFHGHSDILHLLDALTHIVHLASCGTSERRAALLSVLERLAIDEVDRVITTSRISTM